MPLQWTCFSLYERTCFLFKCKDMDSLIWYAGLLTTIILLLLINRHIIWGVWYHFFPVLIIWRAIPLFALSHERSLIIISSSILWWLCMKITTNYINLSLYPKYSLYLLLSLCIFMAMGSLYMDYNNFETLSVTTSYKSILFFLIVVSLSIKTYNGGKGPHSIIRWIYIWWFFGLSFLISEVVQRESLYLYFSWHGIVSIILGIFTMVIWSYTGLQFKEIIRFRKLIWNKITNKKRRA